MVTILELFDREIERELGRCQDLIIVANGSNEPNLYNA